MSKTLLLQLKGPLQSWGADSRYGVRETHHAPTKSGIVGLLAAAEGRRRSDSVEDLVNLEFGVRVDQPGTLLRDYQTAIDWSKQSSAKLSQRYYLSDALFLAGISGSEATLEGLYEALLRPKYPLYLGRRNCPAPAQLVLGIREGDVETALRHEEWMASTIHRRSRPKEVFLPIYRDAREGEAIEERLRDIPVSFDQEHRDYNWRAVTTPDPVRVVNSEGTDYSDPFWEAVTNV